MRRFFLLIFFYTGYTFGMEESFSSIVVASSAVTVHDRQEFEYELGREVVHRLGKKNRVAFSFLVNEIHPSLEGYCRFLYHVKANRNTDGTISTRSSCQKIYGVINQNGEVIPKIIPFYRPPRLPSVPF